MKLSEKSQAVLELFQDLEIESRAFAERADLGCVVGCGKCCANPSIPASPLEFLPLAFELYENGAVEASIRLLDSLGENGFCLLYRPTNEDGSKGFCGNHSSRGLICRLFASAARRNKHGLKELIICKVLKEQKSDQYHRAIQAVQEDLEIPLAASYYGRLSDIDAHLSQTYPINQAIRMAIEMVLQYKFYEESESAEEL
ncbi:YkgJ family cysteine cluster protein [Algoriphagus kandeliae]|uniref:YkgJ family cysteine cluster protein n=1 Tax=Algoriphagus kandeliae TaxID=2562278 RepID=A0A4Y9QTJ8_9BACT|nr:YkgJ family cysteine cluster protein [Algoriphagus kandeliae]TFV95891.1 YkgJ family cysteine cluster protein [Algoriphagus kandeliae]